MADRYVADTPDLEAFRRPTLLSRAAECARWLLILAAPVILFPDRKVKRG